jgi:hypothetical protein
LCPPDNLKRVPLYNPAALGRDVQIRPTRLFGGRDFVPLLVARIKAVCNRRVPAGANPRFVVSGFMSDEFLWHVFDYTIMKVLIKIRPGGRA